ncbi:hypothetical protein DQ04_06961030 [Trypanosoma grayi]|uniref:hypothetical protein n=1 Tax=Trypanosoma grayi TaxID=71804 RepID=UPI0004F4440F|nr:hypothetical protein DQ04_06961030 [Trypanosoma grayi]KEG08539.1 hypothetical protein DQ04_06961030 [Trypanosoma grayi]
MPRDEVGSAAASHRVARHGNPGNLRICTATDDHKRPDGESPRLDHASAGSVKAVGGSQLAGPQPLSRTAGTTDALSFSATKKMAPASGLPLPPYLNSQFSPLLGELLDKIVAIESILRRHAQPAPSFTAFDTDSSTFVDSLSDGTLSPHSDCFTTDRGGVDSSTFVDSLSDGTLSPHSDCFTTDRGGVIRGNNNSCNRTTECWPVEKNTPPEVFLDRLLDDGAACPKPTSAMVVKLEEGEEDILGGFVQQETRKDVSTLLLDEILDTNDVVEDHQPPSPHIAGPPPIVLTPTSSSASVPTEEFFSLRGGSTSVSTTVIATTTPRGDGSYGDRVTRDTDGASVSAVRVVGSMQGWVGSLLQLRDVVATRIKVMQQEVDTYYNQFCECIANADLLAKQSKLNEAVTKLCGHTDRLNTARMLLQQEKLRLQVILQSPTCSSQRTSMEDSYTHEQSAAPADATREEEQHTQPSESDTLVPASPFCVCQTAAPLRDSYLLAREVMSHRRQLLRLVEIFCACPEAVEQWAAFLEEEANTTCHTALEGIFRESEVEKEKLLRAFEIMLWEKL